MDHKTLYKWLVEYCCGSLSSSLVNTQLVFPLDISPMRFTYCATIRHWSSGCHNKHLNEWIIKNNYPLPLISDIVKDIGTKKVFTKLDLNKNTII